MRLLLLLIPINLFAQQYPTTVYQAEAYKAKSSGIYKKDTVMVGLAPGQWLEYDLGPVTPLSYSLTFRYATQQNPTVLLIADTDTTKLTLASTGDWAKFNTQTIPISFKEPFDSKRLRVYVSRETLNFDRFELRGEFEYLPMLTDTIRCIQVEVAIPPAVVIRDAKWFLWGTQNGKAWYVDDKGQRIDLKFYKEPVREQWLAAPFRITQ